MSMTLRGRWPACAGAVTPAGIAARHAIAGRSGGGGFNDLREDARKPLLERFPAMWKPL
jgi:hypothetical protein